MEVPALINSSEPRRLQHKKHSKIMKTFLTITLRIRNDREATPGGEGHRK